MVKRQTADEAAEENITTSDTDDDCRDDKCLGFSRNAPDDISIDVCANSALSDAKNSESSEEKSENEEDNTFALQLQIVAATNYVLERNVALWDCFPSTQTISVRAHDEDIPHFAIRRFFHIFSRKVCE